MQWPFWQKALQWSCVAHRTVSAALSIATTASHWLRSEHAIWESSDGQKRLSLITRRSGSPSGNMERAAMMLLAWPRFHEFSHHTKSIRIVPQSSALTASATEAAAWPKVITTRSMPMAHKLLIRWVITGVPSIRSSCFGFAKSSGLASLEAAGTSACLMRGVGKDWTWRSSFQELVRGMPDAMCPSNFLVRSSKLSMRHAGGAEGSIRSSDPPAGRERAARTGLFFLRQGPTN